MGRVFSTREAELLEKIAGRMAVLVQSAGFDICERGLEAGKIRLLWQVAHQSAGLHENRAAVGFDQPGGDFQQGRFTRTIAPDQRHALTRADGELCAGEERRTAEGQRDVPELKEGRGHSSRNDVSESLEAGTARSSDQY